jgi:hypothetical protein
MFEKRAIPPYYLENLRGLLRVERDRNYISEDVYQANREATIDFAKDFSADEQADDQR